MRYPYARNPRLSITAARVCRAPARMTDIRRSSVQQDGRCPCRSLRRPDEPAGRGARSPARSRTPLPQLTRPGAVVDLDRRRVLFFGEPLMVSMNQRRAPMGVLATVCPSASRAGGVQSIGRAFVLDGDRVDRVDLQPGPVPDGAERLGIRSKASRETPIRWWCTYRRDDRTARRAPPSPPGIPSASTADS